ncbi:MAG: hypothetical protein ACR2PM_18870 [Hyphomicrobiales bacterium]
MTDRTAPIGIVTGLKFESAIVKRWSGVFGANAPQIACAGGRADKAGDLARGLVVDGVQALVSFGIAGGLDPGLKAGTLVLPHGVKTADGGAVACDASWRGRFSGKLLSSIAVSEADLVSVTEPVMTPDAKRRLAETSGAGAVDVESAAVGTAAAERGVPFLVIRAIADTAEQALPAAALKATGPDGSVSAARALLAIAARPGQTGDMLRLARQTARAKRTLARVAHQGLPWFGLV